MKEKYIEECKLIQQNCTYTAEAHHQVATREKCKATWVGIIPAIASALSGTLVASGVLSTQWLFLTIITSVTTAIGGILDPNKGYQEHLNAAKNFTALKHDARFAHEAMSLKLSDDAFATYVEGLHQKYNELIKTVPPTDSDAFEKAQKVIQGGAHEPDRDEAGSVK